MSPVRIVLLFPFVLIACKGAPEFLECARDSTCDLASGGVCLDPGTGNRWCAYPDPNCPSGLRYSDIQVGDSVGGTCVVPPDGGGDLTCKTRVAFVDSDAQSFPTRDVWIANLDGSGLINVSHGTPGDNIQPTWSPTGRQIAFASSKTGTGGTYNIFVVNIDGTGLTNLTPGGDSSFSPLWSPDGTRIAFVRAVNTTTANNGIWTMNANGTGIAQLTTGVPEGVSLLAWSPDGKSILFSQPEFPPQQEYVVQVTGGLPLKLNTGNANEINGTWESTQKIVFSDGVDLYTVNNDGSSLANVTRYDRTGSTMNSAVAPLYASKSNAIVYSRQSAADATNNIGFSLWSIPVQGGQEVQIAATPPASGKSIETLNLQSLSDDGDSIAFIHQTNTPDQLQASFAPTPNVVFITSQVGIILQKSKQMYLFNAPNSSHADQATLSQAKCN